jgi:DNA polymerase III epsilon subunit-like protein
MPPWSSSRTKKANRMSERRLTKAAVSDWETTGLRSTNKPFTTFVEGPQGIEVGTVILDLDTLEVIDQFSTRVRFLGKSGNIVYGPYTGLTWSEQAYRVHGINLGDLFQAPTPAQAAMDYANFLQKHFGTDPVFLAAHNPAGDMYFTQQLMFLGGVEHIKFHHRTLDSFTLGYAAFGAESSDELFERTSGVVRGKHGALQDAELCAEAIRASIRRFRAA